MLSSHYLQILNLFCRLDILISFEEFVYNIFPSSFLSITQVPLLWNTMWSTHLCHLLYHLQNRWDITTAKSRETICSIGLTPLLPGMPFKMALAVLFLLIVSSHCWFILSLLPTKILKTFSMILNLNQVSFILYLYRVFICKCILLINITYLFLWDFPLYFWFTTLAIFFTPLIYHVLGWCSNASKFIYISLYPWIMLVSPLLTQDLATWLGLTNGTLVNVTAETWEVVAKEVCLFFFCSWNHRTTKWTSSS